MNNKISLIILVIIVLVAIVYGITKLPPDAPPITTFEECAAAGYPIREMFPPQCVTPDGRAFTSNATTSDQVAPTSTPPVTLKTCRPTGCSGQVCSDEDVVTTCEFRAEYACYKRAKCERQASGECGWTETAALNACLNQSRE